MTIHQTAIDVLQDAVEIIKGLGEQRPFSEHAVKRERQVAELEAAISTLEHYSEPTA